MNTIEILVVDVAFGCCGRLAKCEHYAFHCFRIFYFSCVNYVDYGKEENESTFEI